ncbi:MAG: acetyl-CoA carboxylase carboxyltransferase subunit alpha [Chthonomonas sp.]|nr:acetyl-CoA carboxylase carboxyltransferase subunit alpha [Chthonomonas sp.]
MTQPKSWKEWEKPLIELDEALAKLRERSVTATEEERHKIDETIKASEQRRDKYIEKKYANLTPWEKVLVARAEPRPYTLDYINALFTNFIELQGDRLFGQDHAIVGGPAALDGQPVMVLGHQKGRNIQERQMRNFAMSKPEGYRKAIRLFQMADRFSMPIITLVDTPAADPGVESESRGISEAIADSMLAMFEVKVPIVSVVIGEGGSGGAIGIGIGNTVLMQEHSVYSVIPPEGCAAILWRDASLGPEASAALRLTAQHALEMSLIDGIIPEPFGGAHRDPIEAATLLKEAVQKALKPLLKQKPDALKAARYSRYRALGKIG